jgi:2'-5' RNA ligase
MRLFIAIDIDSAIRQRIARFAGQLRGLAPGARWVGPETFHITLKFIGEASTQTMQEIRSLLAGIHAQPAAVSFRGTGFFPTPRSARVFWVGIEADPNLARLALQIDAEVHKAGIAQEERTFSPHLTLARAGDSRRPSGSPSLRSEDRANGRFAHVQAKLAAMPVPDFGSMTATEFFLYESKLSPRGAQYTKLESFSLRG